MPTRFSASLDATNAGAVPCAHFTGPLAKGRSTKLGHDEVLRRFVARCGPRAFDILKDFAFVVANHHAVGGAAQDVFGADRHFAPATGGINHVLRHGVARGVTAQSFHDLQPLGHAGAQMRRAGDRVALIDVVRLHAAHQQFLHERPHHGHVVIDMLEQNGLVAQRNASIGQSPERFAHFGRQLAWMIRVHAHEERMKLLQHRAEFGRDALREKNRDARADPDKLHVRNRAQPGQQILQLFIAEQQRVAAAQQDVAHFGMLRDVGNLFVELRMEVVAGGVADEPGTGAIPAICRAPVGDEKQDAVGIAMDKAGHGRMGIFAARIAHFPDGGVGFLDARNDLAADGAVLIRRINQVEEIRRDGEGELVIRQFGPGVFLRREGRHQAHQLFQRGDPVLELPAPVVPVGVGHVGPETAARRGELLEGVKPGRAGGSPFLQTGFRYAFFP